MTNDELVCAARMRIEGQSWAEIGRRLAYDPEYVRKTFKSRVCRPNPGESEIIYPAVRRVVKDEYHGSIGCFAEALGCSRQFAHQALLGDIPLSPHLVDAIRAATGLDTSEILKKEDVGLD